MRDQILLDLDHGLDIEKQEGRFVRKMHCPTCGAPARIVLPWHGCDVCEPARVRGSRPTDYYEVGAHG